MDLSSKVEIKQGSLKPQSLKTGGRWKRGGDEAPVTAECAGSVLVGLRPTNLQVSPLGSWVSGEALNLLLNVVQQCSYPNTPKQVLFAFKGTRSYTTHVMIDFCLCSTWIKWIEIYFISPYFCLGLCL